MRTAFRGHYPPNEEELEDIWNNGLLILDTNALLNLFRYSKSTRDDFVRALGARAGSLWLPHQVGLEFHRRRLDVINQQNTAFDEIETALRSARDITQKALRKFDRHPSLDTAELVKKVEANADAIARLVALAREQHAETVIAGGENERTFAEITHLYDGRVGPPFDEEGLQKLYQCGASRYDKKIPPGYADSQKPEPDRYGDLVIWKQILEKGIEVTKPAIFVTDDAKEDWWQKSYGKTVGPRVELVAEYFAAAGSRIHFYSPERFLGYAKEQGTAVSQESLSEVEQVSTARSTARATTILAQHREQLLGEREVVNRRIRSLHHRSHDEQARLRTESRLSQLEARLAETQRLRHYLEEELHRQSSTGEGPALADGELLARLEQLGAERASVERELRSQRRELERVAGELDQKEPERLDRLSHALYDRATALDDELDQVTRALAELEDDDSEA